MNKRLFIFLMATMLMVGMPIDASQSSEHAQEIYKYATKSCSKTFCKLCTRCLTVQGALSVNGSVVFNEIDITDLIGLVGPTGATGATGSAGGGSGGGLGVAVFAYSDENGPTVDPGQPFTFQSLINTMINDVALVVAPGIGTLLSINTPGIYIFDYGTTFDAAGAMGLFSFDFVPTLITGTTAGSDVAFSWIHGRTIQQFFAPAFVSISPVESAVTITFPNSSAEGLVLNFTVLKVG